MRFVGKFKIQPSNKFSLASHASIGFECLDRDLFDPEQCYDLLQQSGVKYARVQTGWVKCETQKGVYNFEWLDSIVDNLLQRGIQPWFNVGFGNTLYMPDSQTPSAVGQVPICYGPEVLEAWENYAAALAKHYKTRVTYFEIWNEPDLVNFWSPGKSNPLEYAEMVNLTAAAILKHHKSAKIGACMSEAFPSSSEHDKDYFWDFAANVSRLDFFSYHRYATRAEVDLMQNVAYIKKVFALNGLNNVELWGGECGYPSTLPLDHTIYPAGQSNEHIQAVALLRYYVTDAAVGSRLTSFYTIADYTNKPYQTATGVMQNFSLFGLLTGEHCTPKPGFRALAIIANLLGDSFTVSDRFIALTTHYTRPYVNMPQQPFCAAFEKNGKPFYAYYYPTYLEEELGILKPDVCVRIQNIFKNDKMQDPVAVDGFTGDIYEPESREDFKSLTLLYGLPVAEYPIFIVERSELEME